MAEDGVGVLCDQVATARRCFLQTLLVIAVCGESTGFASRS